MFTVDKAFYPQLSQPCGLRGRQQYSLEVSQLFFFKKNQCFEFFSLLICSVGSYI